MICSAVDVLVSVDCMFLVAWLIISKVVFYLCVIFNTNVTLKFPYHLQKMLIYVRKKLKRKTPGFLLFNILALNCKKKLKRKTPCCLVTRPGMKNIFNKT